VTDNTTANYVEKLAKFSGSHVKWWEQKMLFYLTTLNLVKLLIESAPQVAEGETNGQLVSAVEAWNHTEFLCRNYVSKDLVDVLYNVFCWIKTTKELWESLDRIYKTKDVGTNKFVVAYFLDYKMVDTKTVKPNPKVTSYTSRYPCVGDDPQ
jgi:hypothetical protein